MATPDKAHAPNSLPPQEIGNIGEKLARVHLEAKGYRIIASNYRCRWGEVDLVARDGLAWVFVEVRTRRSVGYGSPEESVTPRKAQRLTQTALHFLAETETASTETHWRIDLVAVNLGPGRRVLDINHLENVVAG